MASQAGHRAGDAVTVLPYQQARLVPRDPRAPLVKRFILGALAASAVALLVLMVHFFRPSEQWGWVDETVMAVVNVSAITLCGGVVLGVTLWIRDRATGPWGYDRSRFWAYLLGAFYVAAYVGVQACVHYYKGVWYDRMPPPWSPVRFVVFALVVPLMAGIYLRPSGRWRPERIRRAA